MIVSDRLQMSYNNDKRTREADIKNRRGNILGDFEIKIDYIV